MSKIRSYLFPFLIFAILIAQGCALRFTASASHGTKAQQHQEDEEFIEAITEYRLHLAERIERKTQKEENPYFYYLLIGDCYLSLENVNEAEKNYLIAKQNQVSLSLVAERLRRIGNWYEERNELEQALLFLKKYRDLDPLLFDLETDRIHKKFVAAEIKKEREKLDQSTQ